MSSGATGGEDSGPELDLETRELCADGTCIGVLGTDGRCTECRRTRAEAERGVAAAGAGAAEATSSEESAWASGGAPAEDREASAEDREASAEDREASAEDREASAEDRELCPDGACIGLIGPDGRCKACGHARA